MKKKIKQLEKRFAVSCQILAVTSPITTPLAWEFNYGEREGLRLALTTMDVPDWRIWELQKQAEKECQNA